MTNNDAEAMEKIIKAYNIPNDKINTSDIASTAKFVWEAADKYIGKADELNSKK